MCLPEIRDGEPAILLECVEGLVAEWNTARIPAQLERQMPLLCYKNVATLHLRVRCPAIGAQGRSDANWRGTMKLWNRWVVGICSVVFVSSLSARPNASPTNHKDVAYDNAHSAQKLDAYLAESDIPLPAMVFIHGGGWRAGSKKRVPKWLKDAVTQGWLSVISVEYRFTDVATHPAQVNDCLRAIQFVRHRAAEWNIDPKRIGVTGGSAGGHLTLCVALRDDAANAEADDPVARESSRVACAVSFAGPTDWSLLDKMEHGHPAYRQLVGYEPGTPAGEMDAEKKKDVSPITFASSDDPPVMQVHGDADRIVPIEHARNMHARLKTAGVRTELVTIEGGRHSVAGAAPKVAERAVAFVRELLSEQRE